MRYRGMFYAEETDTPHNNMRGPVLPEHSGMGRGHGARGCFPGQHPNGDLSGFLRLHLLEQSALYCRQCLEQGNAPARQQRFFTSQTPELIQYTNVLVGFDDDQCIPDIVMRPYIILSDAEGNQVTLYGGSIHRSIGYIAYQNRTVFKPGSASYDYVWGIIHHVYGDQFDEDYQG